MRYIILKGTTREEVKYTEFLCEDERLCLPDFYLERAPFGKGV
ncbi:MAG: hypothetical protein ACLFVT_03100 [Syntrophobacteria bacterium]